MSPAVSRPVPNFYTWTFPGSPIEVRLQLSMVQGLQRKLSRSEGLNGAPVSGCGLLFGSKPRVGVTQISGFQPLAVLDTASVLDASTARPGEAVGFYRLTQTSNPIAGDDLALMKRFFAEQGSVALLIENTGVASKAAIAFWHAGELNEFPLMEFPFDPDQLAVLEADRLAHKQARLQPTLPTPSSAPAPRRTRSQLRRTVPVAILIAAAASAGYFWAHSRLPVEASPVQRELAKPSPVVLPAPAAPTLGLSAERHGADLLLSWNAASPLVANASFGVLLVRGATVNRDIALTPDQLRAGKVLYTLTTNEAEIQLNVVNHDQVIRDSVVVILKAPENVGIRAVPSVVSSRTEPREAEESAPAPAERDHLKSFASPVVRRAAVPTNIAEPPAVNSSPTTIATSSLLSSALPSIPPAPAATPARETRPPAQIHSAVAIHQEVPRLSAQLKAVLSKATAVDVRLRIDAEGRVNQAEAVAPNGTNRLLVDAALQSARLWTFHPATVGGQAVPSETVVTFRFTPTK